MFSQVAAYQNEILAGLGIFIVVLLYIIFKNKPAKKEINLDIKPAIRDEYDGNITEKTSQSNDIYDTTYTEENISNIETETNKNVKVKEETKPQNSAALTFIKRSVPPHAKIVKDDFKEFSGKRILLAEDNLINQKVILALLADSKIEIVVANNGQEALDILQQDRNFMMILMDAHMPQIDGFEATKIIRKNPDYNHIVIVALSGDTAADDVKKMKDAGMSEHLEKPLKLDALYDMLYAYNTQTTVPSMQKEASAATVLDTKKGLEVCGGDNTFYTDILNEFLKDYGSSDLGLSLLLKEKKYKEADILLLDISGVSANIGANQINEIAKKTKSSIKNNEFDNLHELLHTYKETLNKTVETIKGYLAQYQ